MRENAGGVPRSCQPGRLAPRATPCGCRWKLSARSGSGRDVTGNGAEMLFAVIADGRGRGASELRDVSGVRVGAAVAERALARPKESPEKVSVTVMLESLREGA